MSQDRIYTYTLLNNDNYSISYLAHQKNKEKKIKITEWSNFSLFRSSIQQETVLNLRFMWTRVDSPRSNIFSRVAINHHDYFIFGVDELMSRHHLVTASLPRFFSYFVDFLFLQFNSCSGEWDITIKENNELLVLIL